MIFYFSLPIISAFIGWGTNFLAIKMLFHPREKINLLFFSLQGIFPKRKKEFSEKLALVISKDFFSLDDIIQKIQSSDSRATVLAIIREKINHYLNNDLKQAFPMIGMFLSSDIIQKIEQKIINELEKSLPDIIDGITNHLKDNIQLEVILSEKINSFTSEKLEKIIFSIMKKEFKVIEFLGALIGFLIGSIQVVLFYLFS